MTRIGGTVAIAASCVAISASAPPADPVFPMAVLGSVVKVKASGCTGGDRSGSGFRWGSADQIVTSLHVIVGCDDLAVYFHDPGADRAARVARVLRRADLALLRVDNPPSGPPLARAAKRPAVDETVFAVGYYLNIPTPARKRLFVGYSGRRLRQVVPRAVAEDLENVGYPDVDLEIVDLDGNFLPGMSGSPIVNSAGELIAIGDGGLEAGAVGASWAIPAEHLPVLLTSSDQLPAGSRRATSLFAVDFRSEAGDALRCGDLELRHLRTRPFNEIAGSTDDPLGLAQLSGVFQWADTRFSVDIYQDLDSGATFVAPSGTEFEVQGSSGCVAELEGGTMEYHILGTDLNTPSQNQAAWLGEVQAETQEFENRAFPDASLWQLDPQWSYAAPTFRADGLMVRRKAAGRYTVQNAWNLPGEYAFETLAARGDAAVGTVAKNLDYIRMSVCLQYPNEPSCPPHSSIQKWAELVLSTHLATFPIQ